MSESHESVPNELLPCPELNKTTASILPAAILSKRHNFETHMRTSLHLHKICRGGYSEDFHPHSATFQQALVQPG